MGVLLAAVSGIVLSVGAVGYGVHRMVLSGAGTDPAEETQEVREEVGQQ
jgi:hypothetical protein